MGTVLFHPSSSTPDGPGHFLNPCSLRCWRLLTQQVRASGLKSGNPGLVCGYCCFLPGGVGCKQRDLIYSKPVTKGCQINERRWHSSLLVVYWRTYNFCVLICELGWQCLCPAAGAGVRFWGGGVIHTQAACEHGMLVAMVVGSEKFSSPEFSRALAIGGESLPCSWVNPSKQVDREMTEAAGFGSSLESPLPQAPVQSSRCGLMSPSLCPGSWLAAQSSSVVQTLWLLRSVMQALSPWGYTLPPETVSARVRQEKL